MHDGFSASRLCQRAKAAEQSLLDSASIRDSVSNMFLPGPSWSFLVLPGPPWSSLVRLPSILRLGPALAPLLNAATRFDRGRLVCANSKLYL